MRRVLLILCTVAVLVGCEDDGESPVAGNPATVRAAVNFGAVNGAVSSIPAGSEDSMTTLAVYITDNFDSEPDRAYFIHRWIRQNIRPDYERAQYYYVPYETQEPATVFATRTAVCTGYAALYRQLAVMTGLDSREIYGYGVMRYYQPNTFYSNYQHAWNAVEIDGQWYLLDTSWEPIQSLDGSSDPNFFFLTDPSDFGYRHYPYDVEWQLLSEPVAEESFWFSLSQ